LTDRRLPPTITLAGQPQIDKRPRRNSRRPETVPLAACIRTGWDHAQRRRAQSALDAAREPQLSGRALPLHQPRIH